MTFLCNASHYLRKSSKGNIGVQETFSAVCTSSAYCQSVLAILPWVSVISRSRMSLAFLILHLRWCFRRQIERPVPFGQSLHSIGYWNGCCVFVRTGAHCFVGRNGWKGRSVGRACPRSPEWLFWSCHSWQWTPIRLRVPYRWSVRWSGKNCYRPGKTITFRCYSRKTIMDRTHRVLTATKLAFYKPSPSLRFPPSSGK